MIPTRKSPIRDCDGCTMCCKILGVGELKKPPGTWCTYCTVGTGCGIHPTRPKECADFFCGYLLQPDLGPEWKPSECKMLLTTESGGRVIIAHVDPKRPDAWQREPYYSTFKLWLADNAAKRMEILVVIGRRRIRIHRDRDEELKPAETA